MIYLIDRIAIPGFSEPVSSMTHLFMIPIFLVLIVFLCRKAYGKTPLYYHVLYGSALIFLFAMSGVFHLLDHGGIAKGVLQRLDHAAIFFFTAASFVPIHGILFSGAARWGVISLVWVAAITGIVVKTIFFEDISEFLGLVFYLSLGWMGLISGVLLIKRYGLRFIWAMAAGGISFTVGAMIDYFRWPILWDGVIGGHEIFHVFVILGIAFHFYFIYMISDFRRNQKKVPMS